MAGDNLPEELYLSASLGLPSYKLTTILLPSPLPEGSPTPIATLLPSSLSTTLLNANNIPSQATPYSSDPSYEIFSTPTKGFGMFATRLIEAGELTLNEHPVLIS
ncbi:hypothetical protein D9756_005683 [Leucocoprinus leucothites]|uniref:Uncharacterized protein n=1 Tax=Leucocoprinus leucothites TaxID=201217 RepID=A0A8H5FZ01_9AGAR|nr:hypothetical protein D9756_005683 [Leucoagaricus leucothites]